MAARPRFRPSARAAVENTAVYTMRSHRPQRVGNVIRQIVGEAIAGRLSDPRIETLTSVTRVEVTADLEYAKVFVSVIGTQQAGQRTLAGLKSARGYVRQMVAKELPLRQCPKISFHLDESLKKAAETLRLIEKVVGETQDRDLLPDQDESAPEAPGGDGA